MSTPGDHMSPRDAEIDAIRLLVALDDEGLLAEARAVLAARYSEADLRRLIGTPAALHRELEALGLPPAQQREAKAKLLSLIEQVLGARHHAG